jgi:hypothetical protein
MTQGKKMTPRIKCGSGFQDFKFHRELRYFLQSRQCRESDKFHAKRGLQIESEIK